MNFYALNIDKSLKKVKNSCFIRKIKFFKNIYIYLWITCNNYFKAYYQKRSDNIRMNVEWISSLQ